MCPPQFGGLSLITSHLNPLQSDIMPYPVCTGPNIVQMYNSLIFHLQKKINTW